MKFISSHLAQEAEKSKQELAARAGQALLEQLPIDQKTLRRAAKLLEPRNMKRMAIAAVGAAAVVSLAAGIGHDRMYQAAVGREIKKQLEPVHKKLDELQAQNEELRRQNEALQRELSDKV